MGGSFLVYGIPDVKNPPAEDAPAPRPEEVNPHPEEVNPHPEVKNPPAEDAPAPRPCGTRDCTRRRTGSSSAGR